MANQLTVKQYINSPAVQDKIKDLLQERSSQFVVSLLSIINTNTSLASCEPQSVLTAAMTAASLDLPINQNLGYAYIIPYKGSAQFQMGWKGFIQLAQRSGQFKTINVSDVREGELAHIDRLTGEYIFEWNEENREKKRIIGYVGYIELINGFKKTLYMTMDELKNHGMRYSQSFKKGYGLWKDNFDAMAHKTVIKLLLAKYAPLSVELEKATLTDQAIIGEDGELTYVDNEPESAREVAQLKERERLIEHIEGSKTKEELEACLDYIVDEEVKEMYVEKLKTLS